jgi:hypothetical protein
MRRWTKPGETLWAHAYDAGEEYADIGRAAGISRQAARQILNPQLRKS